MYNASQPSMTSSTSQLYRLPSAQSGNTRCSNSLQDKGKRREECSTSIVYGLQASEYHSDANNLISGASTSSAYSQRSSRQKCPHLSLSSSSSESDCTQTPPKQCPLAFTNHKTEFSNNEVMPQEAVFSGCDGSDANLSAYNTLDDLSGPTSYSAFNEMESSSHTAAGKDLTSLGLRRRPYQSGIRPFESQCDSNEIMSRIDRESVFSGLNIDTTTSSTRSALRHDNTETMTSSSFKRSFEEAISPSRSPRAESSGNHNQRHSIQGVEIASASSSSSSSSSRAFSSSISQPIISQRDTSASLIGSSTLQSTRRRVPYKRRRAARRVASLERSTDMDSFLLSLDRDDDGYSSSLIHGKERLAPASSTLAANVSEGSSRDASVDNARLRRTSAYEHQEEPSVPVLPVWEPSRENDTMMENTEVPSNTTSLLHRLWADREESLEIRSTGRDEVLAEGTPRDDTQRTRYSDALGTSSALSSRHGPANVSQPALRHLQLQENSQSDDMNIANEPLSAPVQGMQYHDQLMDVFRRLHEGFPSTATSTGAAGSRRPSMLLRSSTMHRSTTQQPDTRRGADTTSALDNVYIPTRFGRDAEDRLASFSPSSATLLPSARAHEARMSRVHQESLSRLRSHAESYAELSRRNQEVLSHYQSGPFTSRLRHSGSPTFSRSNQSLSDTQAFAWDDDTLESSHQATSAGSRLPNSLQEHRDEDRTSSSSTHIPSPGSRLRNDSIEGSPLWGESPRIRSLREQDRSSVAAGATAALPFDGFDYLFPTFGDNPTGQAPSASTIDYLRRSEQRGNDIQHHIDELDLMRRRLEDRMQASRASRLEDEAMVMRTYRDMEFPDPEATILSSSTEAPQLPTLRSPSPLVSPFESATSSVDDHLSSQVTQSRWSHPQRDSSRTEAVSDWQSFRPSLRPLTLPSRSVDRSENTNTSLAASLDEHRAELERISTAARSPRPWRDSSFSEISGRDDDASSQAHWRRWHDHDHDERRLRRRDEASRRRPLEEAAALLPRRLTLNSERSRHMRNQIATASSVGRRGNSIEDGESNGIDMERSSRLRERRSLVPHSHTGGVIGRPRGALEAARSTRQYLPFTRFGPRLSSRYDRHLDEVASSSTTQPNESPPSWLVPMRPISPTLSSSLSNLSRLPSGSNFANSLRSDIARNPGNYVADEDFAMRDTYEGLLQLSSQIGDVRCRSTPSHVIDKLPTCLYDDWLGGSCCKPIKQEEEEDISSDTLICNMVNKGKAKAKEDYDHFLQQRNNRDTNCSICLETYRASEMIMSLPCNHAFHASCVSAWLKTARTCPCCRGNVCSEEATNKGLRSIDSIFERHWDHTFPELHF